MTATARFFAATPPDLLRTDTAAAANTKLLLISTRRPERSPAHTLTDLLAADLPWAQHLGTPDPTRQRRTAAERAATYLTSTGDTGEHTPAQQLLARREHLIGRYRDLTQHPATHRDRKAAKTAIADSNSEAWCVPAIDSRGATTVAVFGQAPRG